jgi:hypothetical protein
VITNTDMPLSKPLSLSVTCVALTKTIRNTRALALVHMLRTDATAHVVTHANAQVPQVLVRELSRDVLELLRALVGSTSFPSIPSAQLASLSASNPHAFGTARTRRSAAARVAALQAISPSDSPAHSPRASERGAKGPDAKGASLNSIAWEQTVAHALLPVRLAAHARCACADNCVLLLRQCFDVEHARSA